jgi:hypothetical protein
MDVTMVIRGSFGVGDESLSGGDADRSLGVSGWSVGDFMASREEDREWDGVISTDSVGSSPSRISTSVTTAVVPRKVPFSFSIKFSAERRASFSRCASLSSSSASARLMRSVATILFACILMETSEAVETDNERHS